MRKQIRTVFIIALLCVFGCTLLLAAVLPMKWHDTPSIKKRALPSNDSSVRFSEKTIHLDPVLSGEIARGSLLAENIGNHIIQQAEVLSNCSCSGVQMPQSEIKPKETIKIIFSIDTKGRNDDFVINFILKYHEDGKYKFDVFYVNVPIITPGAISAYPPSLLFDKVKMNNAFSKDVILKLKDSAQEKPIVIEDISAPVWIAAKTYNHNPTATKNIFYPNLIYFTYDNTTKERAFGKDKLSGLQSRIRCRRSAGTSV